MLKLVWPSQESGPQQRALPNTSYMEISKRRKKLGCELRARLYLYDNAKLIVCSVTGISETGEPTVLPLEVSDSDLGRCVCDHLLEFSPKSPENLRNRKKSDWAAYKVSGAKSMLRFEEKCMLVLFETINLVVDIQAAPHNSLWREISASGIAQPNHEKLGRTIRRTIKAAGVLRENGII